MSSLALHKSSQIAQQIQQRIFKIICIVLFTIQLLQSNFTGRIYLNAEDFSSIEQILNSFNINYAGAHSNFNIKCTLKIILILMRSD